VTGWSTDASVLVLAIATLLLFGLLMSFSASFVDGAQAGDPFGVFKRQLTWAAVGIPAFVVVASVDHRSWRRLSWWLIGLALVGLVLVLVPGVGLTRFGSTRWIGLGPLVVQPTELAKLATLLWLAEVLSRKRELYGEDMALEHLLVPALPLLVVEGVLILLEPDLGTTILLALLVGLVLWIERVPMRFVALGGGIGLGLVALLTAVASYRMDRIAGWLHPEEHASDQGFQLMQSLYALGSGRFFGVGLGSGRGKWDYIPNPETDFIFAIVGEELGLAGALVLLALFGVVLVVGMRIARHAPDRFGRIVAFGITGWVVGQALINVMTVTGLLPITGVTLPLVSVGGSSLLATLVALGILVSIARSAPAAGPVDLHRGDRP
jgi:cell division protein FtsW